MDEVAYKIASTSNTFIEGDIYNLMLRDRNQFIIVHDASFTIEIEFKAVIVEEIQIGLMTSAQILISGMNKLQGDKKDIVKKIESLDIGFKAIVYKKENFLKHKNTELSYLRFCFMNREKTKQIRLNYIFVLGTDKKNSLGKGIQLKPSRNKMNYDFIGTSNSPNKGNSYKPPVCSTHAIPNSSLEVKTKKEAFSAVESNEYELSPLSPNAFIANDRLEYTENQALVLKNSYDGMITGIVVWIGIDSEISQLVSELCEVLGIIVLDQPSEIIDYIICSFVNTEIDQVSEVYCKPVVSYKWILESVNKRKKLEINEFIIK